MRRRLNLSQEIAKEAPSASAPVAFDRVDEPTRLTVLIEDVSIDEADTERGRAGDEAPSLHVSTALRERHEQGLCHELKSCQGGTTAGSGRRTFPPPPFHFFGARSPRFLRSSSREVRAFAFLLWNRAPTRV